MGLFSKKSKKDSGPQGFEGVLTPEFMKNHTTFENLTAMFSAMGYQVTNKKELDAVPHSQVDAFVREHTRYMSYAEMLTAAERAAGYEYAG